MVPAMEFAPASFAFEGRDGLALHGQSWIPQGVSVRGSLIIVHGIGEHCDRYDSIIRELLPRGIAVHSWDQRGHGRSSGRRGHVRSWMDYRHDLLGFIRLIQSGTPTGCPLFVLGHSMGALVLLDTAVTELPAVAGLAFSGTPIHPTGVARPHLVFIARLLSRLWPTFAMKLPIQPEDLMADPEKLERIAADPLLHRTITVRWGYEALKALERVRSRMDRLSQPLLILHGLLDSVNLHSGAQWLHDHAASEDKTFKSYPETRHEPHNDIESDTATRDLADWIEARL